MSGHTVVVGFGVTGVNAARHILGHGADPCDLVVVDRNTKAIGRAAVFGAHGAVLITMLARELCPTATIVTALRESSHILFARRQGADHVVITAEATGKSLGQILNPSEPRLSR